jgi:uncharacterized alkaline shock family protein YloU
MHREESHSDLGTVKIHKNVIASIAAIAATEIQGVKRVGGDFRSGFFELIGKKFLPAIKVEIDKHEDVRIDIPLIISYECNIPDVANKVQENIRNALEKMTNLSIKDIDVSVQGIEKV